MNVRARSLLAVIALGTSFAAVTPAAGASSPLHAWWHLSSRAAPTELPPGTIGQINIAAADFGETGVTGASSPITLRDVLPVGLRVTDPEDVNPRRARAGQHNAEEKAKFWKCTVVELRNIACTTSLAIPAYERLEMEIPVEVDEPAGTHTTLDNEVRIEGGQAAGGTEPVAGASLSKPVSIGDEPVSFGVEEGGYSIVAENADGSVDTVAGSHPFQLTSTVFFNETIEEVQEPGSEQVVLSPGAPALPKNLSFELPPGLLGNVTAAQQCSEVDFAALQGSTNHCPVGSAIGVASVNLLEPNRLRYVTLAVPVYNLEPAEGEPARFGFEADWVPVVLDASVRTDGDYGVTVSVSNATEAAQVLGTQVTFWGDPASEAHDQSRGWACLREGLERNENETCEPPNPRSSTAFLTLPTSCAGALSTAMDGVAWTGEQTAATFTFADALGAPLNALEGCQDLPFAPSIAAEALQPADEGHAAERTTAANTPTGLEVDVDAPQTATLDPSALAESDVQSATVTLPRGVLLNPSAANGLEACSEQQVGYLGVGAGDPFSPGTAEPLRFSAAPAECPRGSKLGTVRVKTPLLAEELEGSVYLAAQEANPFGSLVALYLVAENRALGLRVKLAGESKLDGVTGQITTTFQNTPQVPFESFRVQLFGGPRGAVTTPSACGEYTTTASFTPWSGGEAVASSADPSAFAITSGPGGGPCSQTPPLAPAFEAGSTNSAAGAFTPFQLHIGRADSDQALTGVTVHLPAGMAALLASITPCPEPQAALGTCGPDSLIGHATATVGLGPDPFTVGGGRVYLTGPYGGGPFGLSIVTPAIAGPFNLGDVVVRSSIKIDPTTAAVTIATTLPTIVQGVGKPSSGVPLQLKAVDVTVDRSGFEFNPTNCTATSIGATITGDQGASSDVSSRFQVTGCGTLPFAPKLTATVDGHASKKFGVGFAVKVTSAGLGQANIRKVLLSLPRALPSRLETLQKACDEAIFNANPATCNEASVIGKAVVHTPVLKSPLTGPAYLVSHGGAEFPDVEFLLQGEGITLLLDGKTFIDEKAGITHSRFEAVPDAPFTSFETSLPAGPHSIFGAYVPKTPYNLCGSKLQMPTEIVGQNNAVINKTTIVGVTGCGARGGHITAAQRLAKAVKRCHARFPHSKLKRTSCEKTARRMYGSKKHARRAPSRHASKH